MAGLFARTCRRVLLSSHNQLFGHQLVRYIPKQEVSGVRMVSFSSGKKLQVDDAHSLEPVQDTDIKFHYYNVGSPTEEIKSTSSEKHTNAVSVADPLQHILDHPSASIILRDACKCSKCKDQSTSQRDFNLAHIPADIKPAQVEQDFQGNWVIHWKNDMPGWEDHVSIFTPPQVERLKTHMQNEHETSTRLWDRKEYTRDGFTISYHDYMNSEKALARAIFHWTRHGLIFINDVPQDEEAVERIAQRISFMKSTFYGPTWDIKSVPNAKNVAFTSKYLGFHADLIYLKEPPTVQFLHCIHNEAAGGESRFVDQFKALDTLYSEDRELADALANTKLRYEYENDGYYYTDVKPIVQWRTDSYQFPRRKIRGAKGHQVGDVYRMFWAPQFLGSIISDFGVSKTSLEQSLAAMKKFAEILERETLVYQTKMEPGTCVMFDNLRILHARNQFEAEGRRWLRGTYVDGQDVWSLEVKLKDYMAKYEHETGKGLKMKSKNKQIPVF